VNEENFFFCVQNSKKITKQNCKNAQTKKKGIQRDTEGNNIARNHWVDIVKKNV